MLLTIGSINSVNADNLVTNRNPISVVKINPETAKASILVQRLNEIKSMNLDNVSTSDKKELRKEVKNINTELKHLGNGFYISTGAAIIIILLLILIL